MELPLPAKRTLITKIGKTVTSVHSLVYRLSRGRIAGSLGPVPLLLLTTIGRRSGKSRTTPLGYVKEGEIVAVVASNGGSDWFPSWWLNLAADPHATVQIGPDKLRVVARKASPEERPALWRRFTSMFPGYAKYELRTSREIPVVILDPEEATRSVVR